MLTKTDSEVEQWVLRALSLSEKVRSPEICVLARDGLVTLRGTAQSTQDKLEIEEATRRVTGVVGVVNELRVKANSTVTENESAMVPPKELLSQPSSFSQWRLNAR
ncbi:MAG TPA: BON domain-containing protein [Pyrinomonadaceae bacterium]|nr:BON domain-containing protein [Pyrinomonadaceae bacterium]